MTGESIKVAPEAALRVEYEGLKLPLALEHPDDFAVGPGDRPSA